MRIRLTKWIVTGAAVVSCFGTMAAALAQGLPEELKVDIDLRDADMLTATKMLTQQTGLQFLVEPSAEPFPKITLSLRRVSAEDAIRYICQAAAASFKRDENGVFVISRGWTPDPAPAATSDPAVKVSAPKTVAKIKLLKADAKAVYLQITTGKDPDPAQGFIDLNRFVQATTPESARFYASAPILAGDAARTNYRPVSASALPRTISESGNGILLPGEGAGQEGLGGGAGGGFGGRGGQGQGGPQGPGGGPGGLGQGQGGQTLQGGQGLVPPSIDFVSYDPTDNSIVVRGTEEDIADLQRWISLFDVAPKQVIIKVEFITTSASISRALGFDWLYERGTVFAGNRPGSFARAGDPIFLNYATGNITTRMRTLLQEGYGKVVQAPVLRTLNNQPATVFQQITTSIFINQVVSAGNGQIIIAPQLVQLPVTTGLSVAPRINEDGFITVFLNVPVQEFGQLRRGPDGQEVPDILSQTISVVARVKSGETIALGGLTRKSDTGSQARFPILSELPIIGQFFRSTTRDRNSQELIIFVTPTIVEDDTNGGLGP